MMNHEERLNSIISRLVGNQNSDDIKAAYRDWAETYDQDLDSFGYVAPAIGVDAFHHALNNPSGLILDAGCGTGICGNLLAERGYRNIYGADFSADMLAQARQTGCYQQLTEANFCEPLTWADDFFDGALCIGVYSSQIGVSFVGELARVTKSGGVICMSCRFDWYEDDLLPGINALIAANKITLESTETHPYMTGQDADAAYVVMRVL